ncbi:hypothetical protein LTR56_020664 [Elasticomyces elasticus]|nr:hypothetical protein LTR56_020664 [Elasticomyces elasticus]KAK3653119.1 hypothetical protein LTR22_011357 [Elasticomyces elasticus]KAK4919639.1 hypothetical protein LTR49_012703 [Elasticomyces elasticus]KAK5751226.1 hypothetical protein LTS12_018700 [Elasticomyces elasticus]
MADSKPNKSLEDLHALLSRMCESQIVLTQTVTSLTHTVAGFVRSQTKADINIPDLFNAQTVHMQTLDSPANRTTTETASNAGIRLTDTYELLEMILLQLPMDTLLFAQRVNKLFQSKITNSKLLQQKLFFAPLPASAAGQEPQVNPLLSNATRLSLYYCPATSRVRYCDGPDRYSTHLLRPKIGRFSDHMPGPGPSGQEAKTTIFDVQWVLVLNDEPAATRSVKAVMAHNGSWRRMLLTQPACICGLVLRKPGERQTLRASGSTSLTVEQLLEPLN